MNISEKRIETQVQFWSLLGPVIILLAIAILLIKVSTQWYLPLAVLIGVPLCVKWKLKGLATALAVLFTLFLYFYPSLDLDERYWHVGMGMAMAFSFVILTLSLEEVTSLVGRLQAESQSRLENYQRLDENVKGFEREWSVEKEGLSIRVNEQAKELVALVDEKQTLQKLVYLAKDELITLRNQHEQLLQDLFFKKQEIAQLHERVEENEVMIQSIVNTDSEQRVQQLVKELALEQQEKEKLFVEMEQLKTTQASASVIETEITQLQELLKGQEAEIALGRSQKLHFEQIIEQQEELLKQQREHFNLQIKDAITNLNQSLQKSEEDKLALADRLQHIEEQFVAAKQHSRDLAQVAVKVEELQETVEKKQSHIRELENQLAAKQGESQRIQWLQPQVEGLQKALQQTQHLNEEKEERIQSLSDLRNHLQRELNQKTEELNLKIEEIHRLQNDQEALRSHAKQANDRVVYQLNSLQQTLDHSLQQQQEKELQADALRQRVHELEQELAQPRKVESDHRLPYASGNTRRIEAMYLQLKEQFEEKSAILDQARRELFYAQEQLQSLQREEEEKALELTETESLLQKELSHLIKEAEESSRQHNQEIELLSNLVEGLFVKLASS